MITSQNLRIRSLALGLPCLAFASLAAAQQEEPRGPVTIPRTESVWNAPPGKYSTRAEEIEAARKRKQEMLRPETTTKVESALVEFQDRRILDKIAYGWHGLRMRFGGLPTGSGFAIGPEYLNDEIADGQVVFRASAGGSLRGYWFAESALTAPRLAGNRAFAGGLVGYRNWPQMQYYGPGPDSSLGGRSDYRLEIGGAGFDGGVKPFRHVRLGGSGAFYKVNVGPGTRDQWANTEDIYTPQQAPGIREQTDFLTGSVFAEYDYRDNPVGPRSGGIYLARFHYVKDQDLGRHTHRKLHLEAQQYIPLFNRRRVIALRGRSELTYANPGQTVPFYLQPFVGGSDDLRGFRNFRFQDDNSLVFNAEYRYEVFSGLDMAIFGDAGKVFPRRSQLNFKDLEASYGFGFRFNARNAVFLRIDTGFSHEGWQVWFKFGNILSVINSSIFSGRL
jgi:hypothetical protein